MIPVSEGEARFRILLDFLEDGILIVDDEGRYVDFNEAYCRFLKTTRDELLGAHFRDFILPEHLESAGASFRNLKEGGSFQGEFPIRAADGTIIDLAWRSWANFRPGLHLCIGCEVADRRRAEAAERRSVFLAEASGVLAGSLDYEETLANLARLTVPFLADFCLIFERERQERAVRLVASAHVEPEKEPLLSRIGEIFAEVPALSWSRITRVLESGEAEIIPPYVDGVMEKLSGSTEMEDLLRQLAPTSSLILPLVARGQVLGVVCLALARGAGQAYRPADLAFGRELARRAAVAVDNARLYREARAANTAKDRFLATLSHELRTPLTPVLALTSALEADDRLPADVRDTLNRVRRNVELEARLIDDLLDLTRITRGKLELHREVTDLAEILDQALLTCCTDQVTSGRLVVNTDLAAGDHRLWADAPRLTQVLWNLLNNAVKFTPAGGMIAVRSWAESGPEGRRIAVAVRDSGIGIEPEVLPRIFDGFEQGERTITRRFGGLGLGLAVSKAIVEMHGGLLTAESAGRNLGATFTVVLPVGTLPISTAERESAGPLSTPLPQEGRPLHILLVEDHTDTASALVELLSGIGHTVSLAGNVGEGLAIAAEVTHDGHRAIDLVVSDLGLPDGSGLDLMRELSSRYRLKGIALSGYGMEEDLQQSRAAGFDLHLTKPIRFQDLVTAIDKIARLTALAGNECPPG